MVPNHISTPVHVIRWGHDYLKNQVRRSEQRMNSAKGDKNSQNISIESSHHHMREKLRSWTTWQ